MNAQTDQARLWEIRVGLYCSEEAAAEVVGKVQRVLCPDPEHASPCPVPWSTALLPVDDGYGELVAQARIERR